MNIFRKQALEYGDAILYHVSIEDKGSASWRVDSYKLFRSSPE